ncbi:MAG: glucose 1-dehydrogenase [Acidobacteriia bacterium]|nr:glucose 1-dehydrogenase [Terriglobia bacterium]
MRAVAVFPAQRQVRLVEHPEPAVVSPTEVKLRMLEVGVCGTDREIVTFQYGTPPAGAEYLVIGHESLGEAVEVGASVTRVRPGDLVVPMVRRPCPDPTCAPCRAGRQDFCASGAFTERGISGAHGFMTEFVVDDEKYMNAVPAALRGVAVLTEPLTIAEKAVAEVWKVQQRLPWTRPARAGQPHSRGQHAVVLGAGPVGLLGALLLVNAGFETTVYSRASGPHDKAGLARSFGAKYVAAESVTTRQLAEQVGNIDLVYEATGASRVAFEMLAALGTNGVFVFTGVPGRKGPVEVDTDLIMRNLVLENQIVFGTVNANRDAYEAAIRHLGTFAARWPQALHRLITSRSPLGDAPGLLTSEPTGIKNVITIS